MKKGNQFYLEFQIADSQDKNLDISSVKKVQFTLDNLVKYYDISKVKNDVEYDEQTKTFKVWLTEDETFKINQLCNVEARVLFKNDVIEGTVITRQYFEDLLSSEKIDVETNYTK